MTVVKNGSRWGGSLETSNGKLTDAPITDPIFLAKLESGYQPNGPLLVTVSLSEPYIPERFHDWQGEPGCWKLIAGVIEMPRVVSESDFNDIPF